MAITQAVTDKWLLDLFVAYFSGTFKCALYTSAANLDVSTTVYTTANEVAGTGYTPGGLLLTTSAGYPQVSNGVVYMHWSNPQWPNSSFTARGAMIYNAATGASVAVLDFKRDFTTTGQTFQVTFGAIMSDALLRTARGQ